MSHTRAGRVVYITKSKRPRRSGRRVSYPTPAGRLVEFTGEMGDRWSFAHFGRRALLMNCAPPMRDERLTVDPDTLVCPACSVRFGFAPAHVPAAYVIRQHAIGEGLCDECRLEEAQERGVRLQRQLGINLGCTGGDSEDPRRDRSKYMPDWQRGGHRRPILMSQKITGYNARPDMRHNHAAMIQ